MLTDYIATYLSDEGIAVKNDNLFVSKRPDKPNDAVILYDEPGVEEGYQQEYGSDSMGLLVMTRGSYSFSKDKIWQIHKAIVGLTEKDAGDFYLKVIRTQTPPGQLENDEEGRRIWTAHYLGLTNSYNDSHRQPLTQP